MTDDDALSTRLDRMETAMSAMSARLAALESGLPASPLHAEPVVTDGYVPEYEDEPIRIPTPVAVAKPAVDWESLIGGRWSLWVGALAIFLAMAFFLAYAWQYLAPVPRVLAGFALGGTLLGVAAWVRQRAEPWFAEGIAGAGLGLFYLSIWAAFSNYGLLTMQPTVLLLLAVTALGTFIALKFDAKSQMALALGGGFLTPMVLNDSGGGAYDLTLVIYALVLDAGLLTVSFKKRWPGVAWACLAGTIVLGHMARVETQTWTAFTLATLAFAMFGVTAVGYSLKRGEKTLPHDVLLLFASAFYYAPMAYYLIHETLGDFKALFPIALAGLFYGVGQLARLRAPDNMPFRMAADALALLFLTLTLPAQLDYGWLAVGWVVEAALLAGFALRYDDVVFRQASRVVAVSGAGAILATVLDSHLDAGTWPILNRHTLPMFMALLAGTLLVAYARQLGKAVGPGVALGLGVAALAWAHHESSIAVTKGFLDTLPNSGAERIEAGLEAGLAAGLVWLGAWSRSRSLQAAGVVVWVLAVCVLLFRDIDGSQSIWHDGRPFATLAVLLGGVLVVRLMKPDPIDAGWRIGMAMAVVLLGVWGLSVESYGMVRAWESPGWERQAQLAVSLSWIGSGVACLLGGVKTGSRPFRLLGLGLLGASVLKVFLFDVSSLDTPYRIGAFAGLGLALIGISWLYGRYGVGGKPAAPEGQAPEA